MKNRLTQKMNANRALAVSAASAATKTDAAAVTSIAEPSATSPRLRSPIATTHGSMALMKEGMLRDELAELKRGKPIIAIDPRLIRPSAWANRHEDSFATKEFTELKEEIARAGENVQPILLRPVHDGSPYKYEIVFGNRRHRACLELGISVNAFVVELSDKQLVIAMEAENRGRHNLSPYEQGVAYLRALEKGLFASLRQLSEVLGINVATVSRAIVIAKLDPVVLGAFSSPLDIQFRWGANIQAALDREPDVVRARAKDIVEERAQKCVNRSAKDVFSELVGNGFGSKTSAAARTVQVGARTLKISSKGEAVVFELPSLGEAKNAKIADFIAALMAG
jgi:ParB family chromosome partitioning protein